MKRTKNPACDGKSCPIEVSLEVIGGMWKTLIVRELMNGTRRYSEIHRALTPVTHKMLAQQLRDLENDGVLLRKVYPQVPPKVEYSLSTLGKELIPLMGAMKTWGERVLRHRENRVPAPPAKAEKIKA
jgi:DNA-binding HxlR family transcriptional regulator